MSKKCEICGKEVEKLKPVYLGEEWIFGYGHKSQFANLCDECHGKYLAKIDEITSHILSCASIMKKLVKAKAAINAGEMVIAVGKEWRSVLNKLIEESMLIFEPTVISEVGEPWKITFLAIMPKINQPVYISITAETIIRIMKEEMEA